MSIEKNPDYEIWQSSSIVPTIEAIMQGKDQWRPVETWEEWYAEWSACDTLPHALGLLHAIPLREPRAIRFLVAAASVHGVLVRQINPPHHCHSPRGCAPQTVARAAERILLFQFLKASCQDNVYVLNVNWWPILHRDPLLLGILITWMLTLHLGLTASADGMEAARSFLQTLTASTREDKQEREKLFRMVADDLYRALLKYEVDFAVDEETLPALRRIAMDRDHWGKTPMSLDEAVLRSGVYGQAAVLVLEAEAKARGQQQLATREKSAHR